MINLITENIYSLALLVITIGVLFYLYKTGKKVLVKRVLKDLVIKAENHYNTGQGKRKKQYVIREFYRRTKMLNVFLSKKELDDLIEKVVSQVKKKLS